MADRYGKRREEGVQREKRPCEHCQWRMNKEDPVVCGVCYREVLG